MATDVERLVYQMSADLNRFEKSFNKARSIADRDMSAIERRHDRMNRTIATSGDRLSLSLRNSIAAIGVAAAVGEVQDLADAWTEAENKISAAAQATGQAAPTMQQIADIARTVFELCQQVGRALGACI